MSKHDHDAPSKQPTIAADQIDPRIYDLYDDYCHTTMSRRDFLDRAGALAVAGGAGLAMAQALLPRYAEAQMVSFTDTRIKPAYVAYDSPGGTSGKMRGYLVTPTEGKTFGAVLVIHENRGLNPYIEDVARRLATEGFLAFAPDGLAPIGGYPGNDDDGKVMQKSLDKEKLFTDLLNGAKFLKAHPQCNGKLGAVGFCYGGWAVNQLAVELGDELTAAVPFYGRAPTLESVGRIRAALLMNYAEDDPKVNATRADYEAELKASEAEYQAFQYPGTRHGFHNNSTPRYNPEQAKIAWDRTLAFFKQHLA
ncbi:dienelactone hydrolase family protein [Magnetofaba australis]|uniref:Putative Dienelactone hydrolase n=1 Tax=Magnetofaba australis IT-1 TaxID=1434232 RepID=A0A1Y2K0M2_9PROT|nr:dienelactone hydrolase family protein [Magnetofaba australis]OSM01580.1 putative Dienelactone hydrolase [Magnetofaba australis IT-1]